MGFWTIVFGIFGGSPAPDVNYAFWAEQQDSADYLFAQAYHNMTPLDLVTMLYDNNLDDGSYASATALYTDVVAELAIADNLLSISDLKPDGIIQLMMTSPGGSMLSESVAVGAYGRMRTAIEAVFTTDRSQLLTSDTLAAIESREYFQPYFAVGQSHYAYLTEAASDSNTDNINNSAARLLSTEASQWGIPILDDNFGFGWNGEYITEYGAQHHVADPEDWKTHLDTMPAGNRFGRVFWARHAVPYQRIVITGATPAGTITLTYDDGATTETTGAIDISDPVRAAVATDLDGSEADQLRITIREALEALTNTPPLAVFDHDETATTKELHVYFFDQTKTRDAWPYPSSIVVGPDARVGFNFVAGSPATIVRSDGGSWLTDGWAASGYTGLRVQLATTSANNGVYVVTAATASTLTLSTLQVDNTWGAGPNYTLRKNNVTNETGDTTVQFRMTGFTVPSYQTAEASYEVEMTRNVDLVTSGTVDVDALVTVPSPGGVSADGHVRYADLLDEDFLPVVSDGNRNVTMPWTKNGETWIGPWATNYMQEFYDLGGTLNGLNIDHETDAGGLGFCNFDSSFSGEAREKCGALAVQGGDRAATQYHKAVSNQTRYDTEFGPHLPAAINTALKAGTHYIFDDGTDGQAGWAVVHQEQAARRVSQGHFLIAAYSTPVLAVFPDAVISNWWHHNETGSIIPLGAEYGLMRPVGTHQSWDLYGTHYSATDLGEYWHRTPDQATGRNFYPQNWVIVRQIERDASGNVTVTCFTSTSSNLKGNDQGFKGFAVGHVIKVRETSNNGGNGTYVATHFGLETDRTITAVTDSTITYNDGVTSDARDSDTINGGDLLVKEQRRYIYVDLRNAWNHAITNFKKSGSMLAATTFPVMHWLTSPLDDIDAAASPVEVSDSHFSIELATYVAAAMNGCRYVAFHQPAGSTGNQKATAESQMNRLQQELDAILGTGPITPLSFNQDDFAHTVDYLVRGGVLADGRRVFWAVLRPFDHGLTVSDYTSTPGISTEASNYVDFLTLSGLTIRVPGVITRYDGSILNEFPGLLAYWVIAESPISWVRDSRPESPATRAGIDININVNINVTGRVQRDVGI